MLGNFELDCCDHQVIFFCSQYKITKKVLVSPNILWKSVPIIGATLSTMPYIFEKNPLNIKYQ